MDLPVSEVTSSGRNLHSTFTINMSIQSASWIKRATLAALRPRVVLVTSIIAGLYFTLLIIIVSPYFHMPGDFSYVYALAMRNGTNAYT